MIKKILSTADYRRKLNRRNVAILIMAVLCVLSVGLLLDKVMYQKRIIFQIRATSDRQQAQILILDSLLGQSAFKVEKKYLFKIK